jgi:hypothetical protein
MTKQEQFLWIVQTMVLANAVNMASRPESAEEYRTEISASGVFITMDDAVYASERIPEHMTAAEAAHEFCSFSLKNLSDEEERASGRPMSVPGWAARH